MKCFKLIIFIFFLTIQLINVQGVIDFNLLDIDSIVVNEEYISDIEAYVQDDNMGAFVNLTIAKRFPVTTMMHWELIAASMGEYVVRTGMDVKIKLCDIFSPNYGFIGGQFKLLGFSGDDCPPSPKVYGTEKLVFDMKYFPDSFRPNQYVLIMQFYSGLTTIWDCRIYFRVN